MAATDITRSPSSSDGLELPTSLTPFLTPRPSEDPVRVFVTGASGWIGSALVPDLLAAGHEVVGLARSDASAAALEAAGAAVQRGDLHDRAALRDAASGADGVVHLAFIHDFADFAASAQTDLEAIGVIGDALEGTGKPLVIASGVLGLPSDRVVDERVVPAPGVGGPRATAFHAALALADRGVRSAAVRLAPTVHGEGDTGFVASYVRGVRERGAAGYVSHGDDGDGGAVGGHWPAVHRLDAARLFRLALERAPAGSVLHGTAEEGVPLREVAEVVGRQLGLPVVPVPAERAAEQLGWLGPFLSLDVRASNARTRELLGWEPSGPTLLTDLESGAYTR